MPKRNANLTRNERIARLEEEITLDILEKEDGAVRPEKRQVLETQQRVVVGAIKASPVVKKKLAVEKKTELSAQRKIQPCSAETKRNANLTRNERIARLEEEDTLDTLVKEDRAVRPEENTALLCLLYSVSVRKRHILDCQRLGSRITHCSPVHTRPGGQHSQNLCTPIGGLTPTRYCAH